MKKILALLLAALLIACAVLPAFALESDDEAPEIEIDFGDLLEDLDKDESNGTVVSEKSNTTTVIIIVAAAVAVVAACAVVTVVLVKKKKQA